MNRYALQLYTMRQPASENLMETLHRVREMGWEYVQWSGMPQLPAEDIRKALDDAGLEVVIVHCSMDAFEQDFDAAVKYWKTVGTPDVAAGIMWDNCRHSLEGWLTGAKRLDAIGAKLRAVDLRLSYHNHSFEFDTFDGDPRYPLDILYEETQPQNVYAELDTAWLQHGGVDPSEYIRKYAGRCPVIHAKDLAAGYTKEKCAFTPLGQGVLDWPSIFAAANESNVEWIIYEQDTTTDPFEDARVSLEFFKRHLG